MAKPLHDTAIAKLGEALSEMTWTEMDRIAQEIVVLAEHCREKDEDFDPHRVASMLSDTGSEIVKECEMERAATTTGGDDDFGIYKRN